MLFITPKKHLFLSACIGFITAQAQAQSTTATEAKTKAKPKVDAEEIIVTANRLPTPKDQVATSVSVLTAEDLENSGQALLSDSLRQLPGVAISSSGGPGKQTGVFIRGQASHRTQLYLDGIQLTNTTAPQPLPLFDTLLNSGFDRVEVLKGPQGLLYGGDAGGVVNVLSKTAQKPFEAEASASAGTQDTQQLAGSVRGKNNRVDYALNATGYRTQGFNARLDDKTKDEDGFDSEVTHNKVNLQLTDALSAGAVYRQEASNVMYDNCNYPRADNCNAQLRNRAGKTDLTYTSDTQYHQLILTRSTTDSVDTLTTVPHPFRRVNGTHAKAQYFSQLQASSSLNLSYGLEHLDEAFLDETYSNKNARESYSYLTQAQWQPLSSLYINLGARNNHSDQYGHQDNLRSGLAYVQELTLGRIHYKSSFSSGHRAPSLYETFSNSQWAPSLPQLQPEYSRSLDAGIEWQALDHQLGFTLFNTEVTDEIYYAAKGYQQAQGKAVSQGAELEAQWQILPHLQLGSSYTYTHAELNTAAKGAFEKALPSRARIPKHAYSLQLHYDILPNTLDAHLYYRGQSKSIDINQSWMKRYSLLDASLAWHISQQLKAQLRLTNALDETYTQAQGYASAPRAVMAGVNYQF